MALTRGMMGTGRRTGRARSRSMGLRVVGGGHASGQVVAGSGGGRRKRPGGMPEVALADWAGMSLRDSPWGCPGGRVGRRRRAVRLVGEWRAIGPGRN